MPKETFLNLPEEKRNNIMDVAVTEFADKGFLKCSVQTIADNAGVSKGSMYQYFENKKDIFFYTLDLAAEKKLEVVTDTIQNNLSLSFFELLEKLFIIGIQFALRHPDFYKIYQDIQHTAPEEIRDEFNKKTEAQGKEYYSNFVKQAISQGEIRNDVDEDLVSFITYTLLRHFSDFLLEKVDLTDEKNITKYVHQFVEVLKSGMENRRDNND